MIYAGDQALFYISRARPHRNPDLFDFAYENRYYERPSSGDDVSTVWMDGWMDGWTLSSLFRSHTSVIRFLFTYSITYMILQI